MRGRHETTRTQLGKTEMATNRARDGRVCSSRRHRQRRERVGRAGRAPRTRLHPRCTPRPPAGTMRWAREIVSRMGGRRCAAGIHRAAVARMGTETDKKRNCRVLLCSELPVLYPPRRRFACVPARAWCRRSPAEELLNTDRRMARGGLSGQLRGCAGQVAMSS
ncbi:hypothetical protein OH76DRAFT_186014 [Lentinus brumalis]|uniref:Uncharacterized protein n=1 Tax=Lentinus brumalis TaxID=2498619 RepID=A0A371CN10_9APHY|nr:hypothetical protein OH76DRAFT_186014 [Polyporus brumalis]